MLGQAGVVTTTLSPGATTAWLTSIRALTPALVIPSRSKAIDWPCRPLRYVESASRRSGRPRLWV